MEDQSQLVEYIKGLDGVRKVNQSEAAAKMCIRDRDYLLMAVGTALMAVSINSIYDPISMVTGGFTCLLYTSSFPKHCIKHDSGGGIC